MSDVSRAKATPDLPRRILVTGAGGLLGRAVLDHLAGRVLVTALVLSDPGDLAADVVTGNAADPGAVTTALAGCDAVIHLAALPSPHLADPATVFGQNTLATFTVLEQAGRAGVGRAVVASSIAITGLPYAASPAAPAYLPADENLPLAISDPYALSKQADEATCAMMARRHGMSVIALRFPFLGDPADRLPQWAARLAARPEEGASTLWSYLDLRDAARACELALLAPPGCPSPIQLAAPTTLAPYPTQDLIRLSYPTTPLRTLLPGRTAPLDLSRASTSLNFTAACIWPIEEQPLPTSTPPGQASDTAGPGAGTQPPRHRRLSPVGRGQRVHRVSDQVYNELSAAIRELRLEPGEPISEADLAARLQVSRTPLREAMARLVDAGLVVVVPQVGTRVAYIRLPDVRQAQFIRESLEVAAFEAACQQAPPVLDEMRVLLAEQNRCCDEGDLEGFFAADEALHEQLFIVSGYPGAWQAVSRAKVQLDRLRRLSLPEPATMRALITEHTAIVDALAASDLPGGRWVIRSHARRVITYGPELREKFPTYFAE